MVSALWGPAYPTGSGIYACELAKRFAKNGHEVHVFTSDTGEFNGQQYPNGLHLHKLRSHGLVWDMNPLSNVFFKLTAEDFDIVHVHSYIFFMSNSAAFARAFRDFKYVLTLHGGVDYEGISNESCSTRFWLKDKVYDQTIGRATVRMADKVLSVCKKDIPIIEKKFGVKAEFVPNAVSTDLFDYRESSSKEIVYVGKLERWKGVEDLCKIFKLIYRRHPEVTFKVVGEGSLAEQLQGTNLPIKTAGFVPHCMMPQIYHSSAVSILPSYMEGTPTTCMEASACGVPVVATNVGDTKEIVRDGRSGYIHSPGDIEGIADSVIQLLEDESLCHQMGAYGRSHIVNNYSYDAVINQTLKVYHSLAGNGLSKEPIDIPLIRSSQKNEN